MTPTKPSSSDPSILDMIEEIFGKHWKVDYYDDNTYSYLYFKVSSYPTQKMNQFAKELKDLGLKEVVKYDHGDDGKCIEYQWNKEECVKIWYYPHEEKDDSFNIGVDWVVLKKTGVFDESDIPAKPAPAPQPGPDDRDPCTWCGGDGKCRDCGGSGSVTKWVSGTVRSYVTQNCTSCYSPGKCRDCGGDGWK